MNWRLGKQRTAWIIGRQHTQERLTKQSSPDSRNNATFTCMAKIKLIVYFFQWQLFWDVRQNGRKCDGAFSSCGRCFTNRRGRVRKTGGDRITKIMGTITCYAVFLFSWTFLYIIIFVYLYKHWFYVISILSRMDEKQSVWRTIIWRRLPLDADANRTDLKTKQPIDNSVPFHCRRRGLFRWQIVHETNFVAKKSRFEISFVHGKKVHSKASALMEL